jgi:putative tricarboxylic transport membrane protein
VAAVLTHRPEETTMTERSAADVGSSRRPAARRPAARLLAGRAELGLAALLLALGGFVLVETLSIEVPANANSIGPRFFPTVVGCVLLVVAIWLAVDVLRGGHGDMEQAEDVDASRSSDWKTLAALSAVFLVHAALISRVGFPVAGALLFFGVAVTLGSRRWVRDAGIAVVLSVAVFLVFARALGVGLPAGVLEGVL